MKELVCFYFELLLFALFQHHECELAVDLQSLDGAILELLQFTSGDAHRKVLYPLVGSFQSLSCVLDSVAALSLFEVVMFEGVAEGVRFSTHKRVRQLLVL